MVKFRRFSIGEREVFSMLIGTYEHNMDTKNRVFVPAKLREELGDTIYYKLYPSEKYPSIQLYSKEEFEKQFVAPVEGITNLAKKRNLLAQIYLGSGEASYDSQGRISLSSVIVKKAAISKQCLFIGFGSYVELMSPEAYELYLESLCKANSEDEIAVEGEAAVYRKLMSEGKLLGIESDGE